jgi:hypothetical protein
MPKMSCGFFAFFLCILVQLILRDFSLLFCFLQQPNGNFHVPNCHYHLAAGHCIAVGLLQAQSFTV